jgi:hypothetical protein
MRSYLVLAFKEQGIAGSPPLKALTTNAAKSSGSELMLLAITGARPLSEAEMVIRLGGFDGKSVRWLCSC